MGDTIDDHIIMPKSKRLKTEYSQMMAMTTKKKVVGLSRFQWFPSQTEPEAAWSPQEVFVGSYFEQTPSLQSKAWVDDFLYE